MFQTISNHTKNNRKFNPLDIDIDDQTDFFDAETLKDLNNSFTNFGADISIAVTYLNGKQVTPTDLISKPVLVVSSSTSSLFESTRLTSQTENLILSDDIKKFDVLCGRDKKSYGHCGNRRFRHIIEMNRMAYKNAPSRDHKTIVTHNVVSAIRSCGSRFLKENERIPGQWSDIGDILARDKVSHALRSAKDPNRPRLPKKPRKRFRKHMPTPEENGNFKRIIENQKEIFQTMVELEATQGKDMDLKEVLQVEI